MVRIIENENSQVAIFRVTDHQFINYSYIVTDKKTKMCIIIDPAWEISVFTEFIEEKRLVPVSILLTHHHWDHTNLAVLLAEKYACVPAISEREKMFIPNTSEVCRLKHNQEIFFGNGKITCILTPGHTRGSMCFLMEDFLFTGDTLFVEGVGMCTEYEEGVRDLYHSILYLKKYVDRRVLILPGHRYQFDFNKTFGEVQYLNIYFHFNSLEEFSKFRLRSGQKRLMDFK